MAFSKQINSMLGKRVLLLTKIKLKICLLIKHTKIKINTPRKIIVTDEKLKPKSS